jgi:hypothetical protein
MEVQVVEEFEFQGVSPWKQLGVHETSIGIGSGESFIVFLNETCWFWVFDDGW